jgi:hypothetical protein
METDNICDTGTYESSNLSEPIEKKAPYFARYTSKETRPGCWNILDVEIIERETGKVLGTYERNYSSMYRTFHPFILRGKWYALYSNSYTSTRIMSLPDCKDIGGEQSTCNGFCPTDYYVPETWNCSLTHDDTCPRNIDDYTKPCNCKSSTVWHFPERIYGFIAGCFWGDNRLWKIQYLDLSRADEGIIIREERFGYIELPENLNLSAAIDFNVQRNMNKNDIYLKIATQNDYDFTTGKKKKY